MASSISSSEEIIRDTRNALPSGLRLTAADRPGMAQPVPERDIPQQPWRAMALAVTVMVLLLTSLWEWKMRTLELVPGDLGGSYDRWAELRKQVDKRAARPDPTRRAHAQLSHSRISSPRHAEVRLSSQLPGSLAAGSPIVCCE